MSNITDEELHNKLFPNEVKEFLKEHPSYYKRASKMYFRESFNCRKNSYKYEYDKLIMSINLDKEVINNYPELS